MQPADSFTPRDDDYVLADSGHTYAIYLPEASADTVIDLGDDSTAYAITWFDPRLGGIPQSGTIPTVSARGPVSIGHPASHLTEDWVALIQRRSRQRPSTSVGRSSSTVRSIKILRAFLLARNEFEYPLIDYRRASLLNTYHAANQRRRVS